MDEFNKILDESGEYGEVIQVRHPIVIMGGLPSVRINEMVLFENGVMGVVMAIYRNEVQVSVFSNHPLRTKTKATPLKKSLSLAVGKELLSQTIDPLGTPLSSLDSFSKPKEEREIDILPSGLSTRARINKPLFTGLSIVDLMLPLGLGQKELIVGDRKTGKTDFLLTAMESQAKLGSVVIYCAVARQQSDIKKIQEALKAKKIDNELIIVATVPQNSPSLIFLTPYSAMTIAEYFRDNGRNVLVVIDDLSTHAKFYREISLIAKRFPGRDSFPGDIFYVHARLLERAGNFKTSFGEKAISVLPSAETVEGDFTAFIPTNLMSMTDGHIYFDNDIYHSGRRPAVNIPLSVTRVGRQAQQPLIREINRELMVFFNKYDRLENLSHFGAELNEEVQGILQRGKILIDFFKQDSGVRVSLEIQVVCFVLIWLNLIAKPEDIRTLKTELPSLKIDEAVKSASLDELLEWTRKNKERIFAACKINAS